MRVVERHAVARDPCGDRHAAAQQNGVVGNGGNPFARCHDADKIERVRCADPQQIVAHIASPRLTQRRNGIRHCELLAGEAIDEIAAHVAQAKLGGGAEATARHHKRGKLLPRERVAAILDPGTPFLELSPLAAHGLYGGDAPSAGIVTGVGFEYDASLALSKLHYDASRIAAPLHYDAGLVVRAAEMELIEL